MIDPEQTEREEQLLTWVLQSFEDSPDQRLKDVMQSLVRHLHAFLREVRLTEEEWETGIAFLTDAGHITTEVRQEFILLSDVLGASMQVVTMGNQSEGGSTEATVFGPFFVEGAPQVELGGDISNGAHGQPCWVQGTVKDVEGTPVPHARIEVWESDEDGHYDVQYDDGRMTGRAHLFSDAEGNYSFWGVKPTPYPIQHDGPVGRMLEASGRSPMRAAHLHFMVTADGHRRLVTHIFEKGGEHLDSDTVFGVRQSLVKEFVDHPADEPGPDGRDMDRDWVSVTFDVVLAPTAG